MTAKSRAQVDWSLAASIGRRITPSGPDTTDYTRRVAAERLRDYAAQAEGHVRQITGLATDLDVPPARTVDRKQWVDAATRSMSALIDFERPGRAGIGAKLAGVQAGGILGFLSGAVLGQYDPFGTESGELLLVVPNVLKVERALRLDPDDFRMWVCLHEVTHRVQFAANPWLRDYMRSSVAALTDVDGQGSVKDLLDRVGGAIAGGERQSGIIGLLQIAAPPEQFAAIERMLMLGTLLEGHADHVMDAVGPAVIPTVAHIRNRFDARRQAPSNPVQRVLRAILGVDAKIAQYVRGKAFVDAVVAEVGMERFNRVWEGPQTLPVEADLDDPARWVARVL